jgi:hypothetical protein
MARLAATHILRFTATLRVAKKFACRFAELKIFAPPSAIINQEQATMFVITKCHTYLIATAGPIPNPF